MQQQDSEILKALGEHIKSKREKIAAAMEISPQQLFEGFEFKYDITKSD